MAPHMFDKHVLLKLLYDVQQAISKWDVDELAQKLVVITNYITNLCIIVAPTSNLYNTTKTICLISNCGLTRLMHSNFKNGVNFLAKLLKESKENL
jgi:hypothetical protein